MTDSLPFVMLQTYIRDKPKTETAEIIRCRYCEHRLCVTRSRYDHSICGLDGHIVELYDFCSSAVLMKENDEIEQQGYCS